MNKIKASKKIINNSILVILSVIYMLSFVIWQTTINSGYVSNYATAIFPWILVALLIQMFCFLWLYKVSMSDLGLWFVFLSYLFMFGYVFIDVFEMESSLLWTPIKEYSHSVLFEAVSYVNLSLNMFTLGYLFSYKPGVVKRKRSIKPGYSPNKFFIGLILCGVGGICQLISSINLVTVTQNADSYSAYAEASSSGLIDDISFLFVPGIIYILESRRLNKRKSFLLTVMVVAYFCAIMLLSGSRKTQLFGLLVVVLCYLHTYKPRKFRLHKKIFLGAGGIILLNMVYVIRDNRMSLSQVVPAFFSSLTSLEFLRNLLPETLAETGITLCSVASIMYCVPEIFPFDYGVSIIKSIVSILPIGWLIPDFFASASTTTTINEYLNLPVGASLFGDFYWCWGIFGIFFAFLFGKVLSYFSVKFQHNSTEMYFSLFYIMLMGVRCGVFELMRPLFIVLFVPWVLKLIFKSRR